MIKNNNLNNGYSLPTIIFLFTFISFVLTTTIIWVGYNLHRAKYRIKNFSEWREYYDVLEDALDEYDKTVENDGTSPYSGWFKDLVDYMNNKYNEKDYKITIFPEDSKLDINHIDIKLFFKLEEEDNNEENKVEGVFNKAVDKYLYYPDDLKDYLVKDASDDSVENKEDSSDNLSDDTDKDQTDDSQENFSIYCIPNLNTAGIDRLKLYLKSINIEDSNMIREIDNLRKRIKINYIKYRGTETVRKGLLVDDDVFDKIKPSKLLKEEYYSLFDYKGSINLNFVNKKVFEIIIKACGPKDVKYMDYWNKIDSKRTNNQTIKEGDIDEIFGYSNIVIKGKPTIQIRNWLYYEKFLSVNSCLFMINIQKNDKKLEALIRKCDINKKKYKILKITARKTNEIK